MSEASGWAAALAALAKLRNGQTHAVFVAANYVNPADRHRTLIVDYQTRWSILVEGNHGPFDAVPYDATANNRSVRVTPTFLTDAMFATPLIDAEPLSPCTPSQWLSVLGEPLPVPDEPDDCSKCGGDGYLECDLGHQHDCENCWGTGNISNGTPDPELLTVTIDGHWFDARIIAPLMATILAAVGDGPMAATVGRIHVLSSIGVLDLRGDGWHARMSGLSGPRGTVIVWPLAEGVAHA